MTGQHRNLSAPPRDDTAPVVVGVDGSGTSRDAAHWAGAIAERFGAPLRIVHAMPTVGPHLTEVATAIEAVVHSYDAGNADIFLKEAAEGIRRERPALHVTTAATSDRVDDVLLDASARARLIVLGGRPIVSAAAVLLGSTTLKVTAAAGCPVAVWRGRHTHPTSDPVIIGVDDSPSGRAALAAGFEIAARLGAPVHAVHAWPVRRPGAEVMLSMMVDWDGLMALQLSALRQLVERYHHGYPQLEVDCYLEEGRAGRALLSHLDGAQLAVVGNRGRGVITAALLGSTSLNMLQHSPVPVIVCHDSSRCGA